jgi:hypothetical protein
VALSLKVSFSVAYLRCVFRNVSRCHETIFQELVVQFEGTLIATTTEKDHDRLQHRLLRMDE